MADAQPQKKFRVTTSHFSGPESDRINHYFEVTADTMDVVETSSSALNWILAFEMIEDGESSIVAVFENWDAAWRDGAVTEVLPVPTQTINALEMAPDDYVTHPRPARKDRG